jgi:ERCC4-type nuclease
VSDADRAAQQRLTVVVADREPRPEIADELGTLWSPVAVARPPVGDGRARALLDRFGSAGRVLRAGERELREVPGVGRATARAIRDATDGADAVSESAA